VRLAALKPIVILGGGTGRTLVANRLRRACRPEAASIFVVDRDDTHVNQPGLLVVPFGLAEAKRLTRPRWRQLRSGISYCQAMIDHVDAGRTGCTSVMGPCWDTTS
jgi:sulfide:quinone oxidoreductase